MKGTRWPPGGALNFASGGPGSPLHLAMELLKLQAQIDLHHVPYRGAAPVQAALLGGEVDTAFLALAAPDIAARLTAEGASVVGSTPAQFAAFFRAEVGKWSEVVRVSGVKFD